MPRVLVVDDDPYLRQMLRLMLQSSGRTVVEASDAAAAVARIRAEDFDAALVDYCIPEPEGLRVLALLREVQPHCVRILMSGALDLQVVVQGINRGEVEHVVQKPCSRASISAAIEAALLARAHVEQRISDEHRETREHGRRQLEQCISDSLLSLALQPVVQADHGAVYGYEALLRSSHSALKTPLEVIAAAERYGLLGRVAESVSEQVAALMPGVPEPLTLFVNLHPWELREAGEISRRFAALRPWASRIVMEITERCELPPLHVWRSTLDELISFGFRIAVDDLGAGYNSLAALAEIRPDFAKIDMSIVRGIDRHERKQRLVELLCAFSRATGTLVVVEGIETEAEATTVRSLGADLLQGYLFGRPRPAASVCQELESDEPERKSVG